MFTGRDIRGIMLLSGAAGILIGFIGASAYQLHIQIKTLNKKEGA